MSGQQRQLMRFDPVTGAKSPYPSEAEQYREYHGKVAWLYNPWTGILRNPRDIGFDVVGLLITPNHESILAARG